MYYKMINSGLVLQDIKLLSCPDGCVFNSLLYIPMENLIIHNFRMNEIPVSKREIWFADSGTVRPFEY